jgi:hypothetical protein
MIFANLPGNISIAFSFWVENKNYGAHWRRYETFYGTEIDALRFVCSAWLVPKRKLYRFEKPHVVKAVALPAMR